MLALLVGFLAMAAVSILVAAAPVRFLAGISLLLDHRGQVALGGAMVLLGLGVGVLAALAVR
jgi:hypothetical protein